MKGSKRLDQLLVEQGHFASRTRAQAAILAGVVFVNGKKIDKAGTPFAPGVAVEIKGDTCPYASRGGTKLEGALKEFRIEVKGRTALDVGASTGGFTDCLLQGGAQRVYAIDVGYGQLDWKLRNDPRVAVIERTNVRHLTPEELAAKTDYQKQATDLCVIDVSFISLSKVLPAVYNLLGDKGEVVALIKPQFEAERGQVGKGGIVKDPKVHEEVIEKVKLAAEGVGFKVKGVIQSPITGAEGNVEFLIHLLKAGQG